jgi:L-fuculose-phosphate aldolase
MANPWKLRQEMCEIGRRIYDRGLVSAFEGNLSVRIGPDRLLCTPSLMCKGLLKPEDLCVVDLTGKQISGERKRSSEIYLHLGIYRERPEAQSVVHTHAPNATAFSVTHTPLPNCITGEVEVFLGEVPLAPYATPGSEQMGSVVSQMLRDANPAAASGANQDTSSKDASATDQSRSDRPRGRTNPREAGPVTARPPFALFLANHGVVSWGQSLEEALHRTEILESYCRTLIIARSIGPVQRLNDQNMRDLMELKQKLGIPDRRAGQQSFENCDLCGNNEFGRGFSVDSSGDVPRTSPATDRAATDTLPTGDIDAMVREITDRVWSALRS